MDQESNLIDNETNNVTKRPMFLKVLCILTFVGSGLGILGGLWGFSGASTDMIVESVKHSREVQGVTTVFNEAEYAQWYFYSSVAGLIGSLACLTGALLMWKLKKIGYFIYLPGYMIPFIVSIVALPHMDVGVEMSGFIGAVSVAFNGLIMLAFFIMYGVNVKHMK